MADEKPSDGIKLSLGSLCLTVLVATSVGWWSAIAYEHLNASPPSANAEGQSTPSYTLLGRDSGAGGAPIVKVRLNGFVSEAQLQAIATQARRAIGLDGDDNSFAWFFLPDQIADHSDVAWATASFDKSPPQVLVIGFKPGQAAELLAGLPGGADAHWIWNRGYVSAVIALYKHAARTSLEARFLGGIRNNLRLHGFKSSEGERFLDATSDHGDYYLVLPDGRLQIGDHEGIMATLNPSSGG